MSEHPRDESLLGADEPPPYAIDGAGGASPFLLICDHAGRRVPRRLGDLGVSAADWERHIAWDIGAGAVASLLGGLLDAFVVRQTYSRLVIDCNRPLGAKGSIACRSEVTDIPGNVSVGAEQAALRAREIFTPYHDRIAAELDRRAAAGRATLLVALHSFTPTFHGVARPWHIGMLYGNDRRVARRLLECIRSENRWNAGDNEPYAVTAETDYAIPVHGERRGLPHVGIELRQDLVQDEAGQREWAERLARWLLPIAAEFAPGGAQRKVRTYRMR